MSWNAKEIRHTAWDTAFRRGWRAWLSLATVCFLFAFVGAANASQALFVDLLDHFLGGSAQMLPSNIAYLKSYLSGIPLLQEVPFFSSDLALVVLDNLTESTTWVIRLFAINPAYFQRNPGEVIAGMLSAALLAAGLHFFVQNGITVGQVRYAMETRFQRHVSLRRVLAPFHLHYLPNLIWVTFRYHLSLTLWGLTIIGGLYKSYQYSMVPYLLAENPMLSWREARQLSAALTKGYKWKLFCLQLSYLPISLLKFFPLVGLCISVPFETEVSAEAYFTLRANPAVDRQHFREPAFDGPALVRGGTEDPIQYRLENLDLEPPFRKGGILPYRLTDFIFFFFAFCIAGWVWEVVLHLIQTGTFANRGTLYGPWIPIYGVGGTAVILLLNRFKGSKGKLFALTMALCAALEYLASFLLDYLFNASYWDYKGMLFNVNGRICLAGLLAFGIGGLFAVYAAAPVIARIADRFSLRSRSILSAVLILFFAADLICCMVFGFNRGAGVGGGF